MHNPNEKTSSLQVIVKDFDIASALLAEEMKVRIQDLLRFKLTMAINLKMVGIEWNPIHDTLKGSPDGLMKTEDPMLVRFRTHLLELARARAMIVMEATLLLASAMAC